MLRGRRGLRDSRSQRLVLSFSSFLSLTTPPPSNDSDSIEKGSEKQGLKTEAQGRRGDIPGPIPSTFAVSHLLATALVLLLLSQS